MAPCFLATSLGPLTLGALMPVKPLKTKNVRFSPIEAHLPVGARNYINISWGGTPPPLVAPLESTKLNTILIRF